MCVFADETLDALEELLLAASPCSCCFVENHLPESLGAPAEGLACSFPFETIERLNHSDSAFRSWWVERRSGDCLFQAMLHDLRWKQDTPQCRRVWGMINLKVRLHTLEHRFAEAVFKDVQGKLYHLAYGLSHELNNPLANIATRAGVLLHEETRLPQRQLLDAIIDNAMRGSEMIGDMMLIARPPTLSIADIDFERWFDQVCQRASEWCDQRQVTLHFANALGDTKRVRFDPIAIQEALWCFVRNAIEAVSPNGTVQLNASLHANRLEVTVCDDGPGLSSHALAHAFDLFFSGREAGRGLGMGLAKADRVIKMHRGTTNIHNRVGGGCEVRVVIPQ